MIEYVHIIFLTITTILVIRIIQLKSLVYAVLCFLAFTISIACLYALLGAPLVALFQVLIYTGAVSALFLIAVMLVGR